jgi:RNA polymerase sigma factor (sigma-70 family)
MDPDADAACIAASLAEPALFGALFDRYAGLLYRYLARRVGVDEADALLGEVFRVAFERRATFDHASESARPWLYGIATRLVANHRRREARRLRATARLLAAARPADDQSDAVAERLDAAALWPLMADTVDRLPDGERDALLLHVWEGLSYKDVAASLQVPVGTVRSRLNRARRRLSELARTDGEELLLPMSGVAAPAPTPCRKGPYPNE